MGAALSKTLLEGVNEILNRTSITSANGEVSSLSNAGKQVYIDTIVQIWNETIDLCCNQMGIPKVGETGSSTLTLVTDTREYDMPSDLVQLRFPLIDYTNGHYIWEWPGGYQAMRIAQFTPSDWTGLPYAAAINPTTNKLRLDRTPTSAENGNAYDLLYDKDLAMTVAADVFPFSDAAFRATVPVVAEVFERRNRNDFDEKEYRENLSRALSFMNKVNRREHW